MSENINLSIPPAHAKDTILFKMEKKTDEQKRVQKFRSFAFSALGEISIMDKKIPLLELYKLLFKYGLSKTVPSFNSIKDKKLEFTGIDWSPTHYGGPTNWEFKRDHPENADEKVLCSIVVTPYGLLYLRVHDMTVGLGEKVIESLMNELYDYYIPLKPAGVLQIYTTNQNQGIYYWQQFVNRNHRSMNTIYINDSIKDKVLIELDQFYKSEHLYDKFCICWKFVTLISGEPGIGKSSFILACASKYNKNICKLTLTPNLTSQQLESLFKTVPENSMMVIEDIDSILKGREVQGSIDFSTILNCLDGLTSKRGLVLFMTANHVDKLDPAFVRPGRVDLLVEFKLPSRSNLLQCLNSLVPEFKHEHEEFLDKVAYEYIEKHEPELLKDINNMGLAGRFTELVKEKSGLSIPKLQQYLFGCIINNRTTILDIGDYFD